ncbi:hypothetical protein E3983_00895 [Legionella israelensis]|uniref:ATP-binding protein n=1 Tax=Legionella israelensis TaxID=454 RepID=A0AAX1ED74_9GAMM|nr:hypothetical protein [Legionella israelensis]QBR83035.1 hypothetical protein E3983_00895 [Legionella israelensis]
MPYIFLNQLGEYGRENHAENINYIPEESKDSFLGSFIGNRERFQAQHYQNFIKYKKTDFARNNEGFSVINLINAPEDLPDTYFRRQLIYLIYSRIQNGEIKAIKDVSMRGNPETATISLKDLLGDEGITLYQYALQEEVNSPEYRLVVVNEAISHVEGNKTLQRPIMYVAGPSGCGKSYSSQFLSQYACDMLEKDPDNDSGNVFISIDGGIGRDVSQMRRLMILLSNVCGYTGVKDLYDYSNGIIAPIKNHLLEAAIDTPGVGIIIPETFSKLVIPFNSSSAMKRLNELEDSTLIFTRIKSEHYPSMRKTVKDMGDSRSWKSEGYYDLMDYDLNRASLKESKKYNPQYFENGRKGSYKAQKQYMNLHHSPKLLIECVYDLQYLKPEGDDWVPARYFEKEARPFSQRVYNDWHQTDRTVSLPAYAKAHPEPEMRFSSEAREALEENSPYVHKNLNM